MKKTKIQKDIITPQWLTLKEMYENGTNGSKEYGANFPIGGELDQLSSKLVNELGLITYSYLTTTNRISEMGLNVDLYRQKMFIKKQLGNNRELIVPYFEKVLMFCITQESISSTYIPHAV